MTNPVETKPESTQKKRVPNSILVIYGGIPYGIYSCFKNDATLSEGIFVTAIVFFVGIVLAIHESGKPIIRTITGGHASGFILYLMLPAYVLYTIYSKRYTHPETGLTAIVATLAILFLGAVTWMEEEHARLKGMGYVITPMHFFYGLFLWKTWKARFTILAVICMFIFEPELTTGAAGVIWDLLWGPIPTTR